ncbi:MAG: GntR family transcriptional regulator [Burkholderiales bacterium]
MLKDHKSRRTTGDRGTGALGDTRFDDKSGAPRYMQLASVLRHEIASGKWPVGHQLPTVQKISEDYGLAKITVRQAFAILVQDDLIVSERGRGTYVRGLGPKPDPSLRSAINDMIAGSGILGIRVLEEHKKLSLPPNLSGEGIAHDAYTLVRKLHLHDGEPFALVEFYVAASVFKKFPRGSEKKYKIAHLIRQVRNLPLGPFHQTITVEPADYDLARLLGYSFSAPVAKIRRVTCDASNRIVTAGFSWYRGDRFILDMQLPADMTTRYPAIAVPNSR